MLMLLHTLPANLGSEFLDFGFLSFDDFFMLVEFLCKSDIDLCLLLVEGCHDEFKQLFLLVHELGEGVEGFPFSDFDFFLEELLVGMEKFCFFSVFANYIVNQGTFVLDAVLVLFLVHIFLTIGDSVVEGGLIHNGLFPLREITLVLHLGDPDYCLLPLLFDCPATLADLFNVIIAGWR